MTKPVLAKDIEHATPLPADDAPQKTDHAKRKKLLLILTGSVLVVGAAVGAYQWLVASKHVVTDNAYVGADVAQVTPLVAGAVSEVRVSDTQAVKAGDVLVVINDIDARLELAQARAALGQAERRVRGYMANDTALSAQIAARSADQGRAAAQTAAASADLEKARLELERREKLAETGAVSGEELTRVRASFRSAEAGLRSARAGEAQAAAARASAAGSLNANAVLTAGAGVGDNPEVLAARARVTQAEVNLERTVLRAPFDGVVTRRQVQVGQRVSPGAQLMTIVPVQHAYVDANFKEVQLAKVRPGQPVELESDLYGSSVRFHGRVAGFSGGTGSAFAIIPAQNATGNWIKVVQRLPVRITLDPAELARHPLRVGLTMKADINVSQH